MTPGIQEILKGTTLVLVLYSSKVNLSGSGVEKLLPDEHWKTIDHKK